MIPHVRTAMPTRRRMMLTGSMSQPLTAWRRTSWVTDEDWLFGIGVQVGIYQSDITVTSRVNLIRFNSQSDLPPAHAKGLRPTYLRLRSVYTRLRSTCTDL